MGRIKRGVGMAANPLGAHQASADARTNGRGHSWKLSRVRFSGIDAARFLHKSVQVTERRSNSLFLIIDDSGYPA